MSKDGNDESVHPHTPMRPRAAKQGEKPSDLGEGWAFQLKEDGCRATLEMAPGRSEVILANRQFLWGDPTWWPTGYKLDDQEVPPMLKLDGELQHEHGFASLMSALATFDDWEPSATRSLSNDGLFFTAFDVLRINGESTRDLPFRERDGLLRMVTGDADFPWQIKTTRSITDEGDLLLAHARRYKEEGIVAKRLDSTYLPGMRPEWVKFKNRYSITCIGYRFRSGNGIDRFGSVDLALMSAAGRLSYIGKVGSGFNASDVRNAREISPQTAKVMEIECARLNTSGDRLIQPTLKSFRPDITLDQCTIDQLTELPRR